ncbi:hypothetical protein FOZ61_005946 [Perkinsus olseni]|uniref:Uncharacterized protein n=1 Tax=Perkinsus olseni TaxID=32597 RepID=A0A7J6MAY5_PEROL|nr:hypothetical protein FOZ61_005946 [Perkinsus olseni]KAF4674416.1 hypothetical protein FOL46_004977 [Perkinsus olseni]
MAKGNHDTPSVTRKLKAIYEALDGGNNKQALKLANAQLSLTPDNQIIKALASVALDRLGRHSEALALCDELLKEGPPTDDTLISTMAVVYRANSCYQPILKMYQKAVGAEDGPELEEGLTTVYVAALRVSDWTAAQQAAMRLAKAIPGKSQQFLCGYVLAVLLSRPNPTDPVLRLAKASLSKVLANPPEDTTPRREASKQLLWLSVLVAHEEWEEAITTVDKLGAFASDGQKCRLRAEIYETAGQLDNALTAVLADSEPDMSTIRKAVSLAASSGVDSNITVVREWLQEASIGERPQSENDIPEHDNSVRYGGVPCASLARLGLMLLSASSGDTDNLVADLEGYVESFGHTSPCYFAVRPYLSALTTDQAQDLGRRMLKLSEMSINGDSTSSQTGKPFRQRMLTRARIASALVPKEVPVEQLLEFGKSWDEEESELQEEGEECSIGRMLIICAIVALIGRGEPIPAFAVCRAARLRHPNCDHLSVLEIVLLKGGLGVTDIGEERQETLSDLKNAQHRTLLWLTGNKPAAVAHVRDFDSDMSDTVLLTLQEGLWGRVEEYLRAGCRTECSSVMGGPGGVDQDLTPIHFAIPPAILGPKVDGSTAVLTSSRTLEEPLTALGSIIGTEDLSPHPQVEPREDISSMHPMRRLVMEMRQKVDLPPLERAQREEFIELAGEMLPSSQPAAALPALLYRAEKSLMASPDEDSKEEAEDLLEQVAKEVDETYLQHGMKLHKAGADDVDCRRAVEEVFYFGEFVAPAILGLVIRSTSTLSKKSPMRKLVKHFSHKVQEMLTTCSKSLELSRPALRQIAAYGLGRAVGAAVCEVEALRTRAMREAAKVCRKWINSLAERKM